jgi:hypothetical protein
MTASNDRWCASIPCRGCPLHTSIDSWTCPLRLTLPATVAAFSHGTSGALRPRVQNSKVLRFPKSTLALTTLMLSVACALGACAGADSDPDRADVDSSTEESAGRLPPEEIQRVVRSHFTGFRACQSNGRDGAPAPGGTVRLRFVIDRDGSVRDVEDVDSDLPDSAVVACVARLFETMTFPEPAGGVISVTYPIVLSDESEP